MTSPARLLGAGDVRALAAELDLRPTKRLGQNFVHDANTVRRIVRLAEVGADDVVLEVGPGLGSLTLPLLEAARAVVAVEIDPVLADRLPATAAERAPGRDLRVVTADALRLAPGDLPLAPDVLVANLPYNVAVPVVLNLLAALPGLRRGLVMVQSEVAERLAARPGERAYGAPSVKLAWYADARRAGPVPRAVFWPVPGVDSGLVGFTRHDRQDGRRRPGGAAREDVFAVVDAAFAQRRKSLRAALAGWAGSAPAAEAVLRAAGVDPGRARGGAGRGRVHRDRPRGPARPDSLRPVARGPYPGRVLSAVGPPVTVRVPAKINLHLAVGDLRPDGYHDLVTVFQALSITDEVSVTAAVPGAVEPGVAVSPIDGVDASEVPADTTNLAWRAVEALARRADRTPDVRIGLRKAIPVAGGMAGGSADAAGALLATSVALAARPRA